MKIVFDNQIYEIDEEFLNISDSLKWLADGRSSEDEPIPLQKCTVEIFEIFMKWFNKLKKEGIRKLTKTLKSSIFIFKTKLFVDYDFDTLTKLLEFGFNNQIELLFNTIAYVIYKLKLDYSKLPDVYKNIIEQYKTKYPYEYNAALMHVLNIKGISVLELDDENYNVYVKKSLSDKDYDEECKFDVVFTHYDCIGEINTYFIVLSNDCVGLHPIDILFVPLLSANYIKRFYYSTKNKGCCFDEHCLRFLNKFYSGFSYDNHNIKENLGEYLNFMFGKNYISSLVIEGLDDTVSVDNKLVQVKRDTVKFIVESNIKHICDFCFGKCDKLRSVILPDSIETIGKSAFEECESLTTVVLPNSVKTIGICAFEDCENLSSINLPDSVKTIGDSCFFNCKKLKTITIPGSVKNIGECVFKYSGLSNVIINNGIKYLSLECFKNCDNLVNVDIPESVEKLDGLCFAECENLTNVKVPKGININYACFRESDNVKLVYY